MIVFKVVSLINDQISSKSCYSVYYSIDIKHYSIFALKNIISIKLDLGVRLIIRIEEIFK